MRRRAAWSSVIGVLLMAYVRVAADEGNSILSQSPLSWFRPSAYFSAAAGSSSADDPGSLAVGHHDPTREGGTVQGIELGLSVRAGDYLHGFATHAIHYGAEQEWENEWEEGFLKLSALPGGFDLRGGRMLSRYGSRNDKHLHAWHTVNMPLVLGRFLGDDGLTLDGGDIAWRTPVEKFDLVLVGGCGRARSHLHDHGVDERRADYGLAHDEGTFDDPVGTGRVFSRYLPNDFHHYQAGASVAIGDNGYGQQSQVYGLDFSYTWREHGLEPGGRALQWNTELLHRRIDAEPHAHEGEESHVERLAESGAYSEIVYAFNVHGDVGCRVGYVEGINDLGVGERFRVSPVVTAFFDNAHHLALRVQYDYDNLEHGEGHSAWAQLGLAWGGPEVR